MRLPLYLTIASIAFDPVASFSYLDSLGREKFSGSQSGNAANFPSNPPHIPQHELASQAENYNPRPVTTPQHLGLSSYADRLSSPYPTSNDTISGSTEKTQSSGPTTSRFQSYLDSIPPSHSVPTQGVTSYLDSISQHGNASSSFSDISISSQLRSTAKPPFGSPFEGDGAESETTSSYNKLGGADIGYKPITQQKWTGTSYYLDSLSNFQTFASTSTTKTTLHIETRQPSENGNGHSGVGSYKHSSPTAKRFTFRIPAENLGQLLRQLKEKGGTLRFTGTMDDLSFED